jgi:signal transduction histidine kinase
MPQRIRDYLPTLAIALLYFLTGKVSIELLGGIKIVNVGIFAAEGFALAFAVRFGPRVLPGIFVGQLILALSTQIPLLPALGVSTVNTLEALLGILLFRRFRIRPTLDHFRDIFLFALLVLLILQPFSAFFSNLILLATGELQGQRFFVSLFSWWFGNIMGQLLFTPFLLQLLLRYREISLSHYLTVGIAFGLYILLLEVPLEVRNPFLLYSLTIPVVVIAIALWGMPYGTMLSAVTAIVTALSIAQGVGTFNIGTTIENTINYNLFILTYITSVLTMGVLFEERRRYAERLQRKIEEAVRKNREQQLFLMQQSRLAQMGEMLSMIAHQWRQPLNNLSLLNQMLLNQQRRGEIDSEKMEEFAVNSQRLIRMMSQTIDDFRNFFKPEERQKPYRVDAVVEQLLDMTGKLFAAKGIQIEWHAGEAIESYGYPNALAQVLLNLLNNAKDALLEQSEAPRQIRIEARKEGEEVLLEITDTAGGIPEEILPRIFDPYFSTKKEKNGTGLGLYMSKMLVEEQMGGRIDVHNTPEGARFTIRLPGKKPPENHEPSLSR